MLCASPLLQKNTPSDMSRVDIYRIASRVDPQTYRVVSLTRVVQPVGFVGHRMVLYSGIAPTVFANT